MFRDKSSRVDRILTIALLINTILSLIKLTIGFLVGSLSLQTDALHSMTNKSKKLLSLIANRSVYFYRNREYPYGYQKFEAIAALTIIAFLTEISFKIVQQGMTSIWQNNFILEISNLQIYSLISILGINTFIALYERRIGKKINSSILINSAELTLNYIWLRITVLIGLIVIWRSHQFNGLQWQWLDLIIAIGVGILVFKNTLKMFKPNLSWLVDEIAIEPEKIKQIVMQVPGVIKCFNISSRGLLGKQVFIEIDLIVATNDLKTAHQIGEKVKDFLQKSFNPVKTLIHLKPQKS